MPLFPLRPANTRVLVRLPLGLGHNRVQAQREKGGVPNGLPVEQQWFVRLRKAPKAQVRTIVTDTAVTLDAGASDPRDGPPAARRRL